MSIVGIFVSIVILFVAVNLLIAVYRWILRKRREGMKTVETYKLTKEWTGSDDGAGSAHGGHSDDDDNGGFSPISIETFPRVPPGEKPPTIPGDISKILPTPGPYSPPVSGKSHKSIKNCLSGCKTHEDLDGNCESKVYKNKEGGYYRLCRYRCPGPDDTDFEASQGCEYDEQCKKCGTFPIVTDKYGFALKKPGHHKKHSPHSGLIGGCAGTRWGCCADGHTPKADESGSNCKGKTHQGHKHHAHVPEGRHPRHHVSKHRTSNMYTYRPEMPNELQRHGGMMLKGTPVPGSPVFDELSNAIEFCARHRMCGGVNFNTTTGKHYIMPRNLKLVHKGHYVAYVKSDHPSPHPYPRRHHGDHHGKHHGDHHGKHHGRHHGKHHGEGHHKHHGESHRDHRGRDHKHHKHRQPPAAPASPYLPNPNKVSPLLPSIAPTPYNSIWDLF